MKTQEKTIEKGYKQTEIGVIPADWNVKTFKEICWVNQGLQIEIEKRLKNPRGNSKKYITIQYLNDGREIEYIDDYSASVCCEKDDILMTRTGNTGIVVTGVDGVFHNNFFKINFDKKQVDKDYFLYYLRDNKTKKIILEKAGTSTIPDLNHNDFYSIKIPLPDKPEQISIATALSDIDTLIQKTEDLIDKKKATKQGAMQELLTGKRRLPGFNGEWEEKRLGDICDIRTGKKDVNQGHAEGVYPFFTCSRNISYSNEYSFEGEAILIAGNGEVGNLHYYSGRFEAYQRTYVLQDFNVGVKYLWYQLDHYFKKSLGIGTIGTSIPYIKKENIAEFIFKSPTDKKEQIAIATILSDMDTEIEKLESELTKWRDMKQGMMQTLLTGKIRLIK